MTTIDGPAGEELLLLDTHKLYLPEREESINANLWDISSEYYHRALDEWPDTVAPFVAVTEACADVMAPLRLPPADSSAGHDNGASQDIPLQALALSPDDSQLSGGDPVAEARQTTCSQPRSAASKRKRDSFSDDGDGSTAPGGAPASADIVTSGGHCTYTGRPDRILSLLVG